MSKRNVGDKGESVLQNWAGDVGITANRVQFDRTGWDFLLEFSVGAAASSLIHLPLDKDPFPLQCLCQVKSSDKRPGSWSVKLDNWLRLVKSPLPAFFLVLEFDGQTDCQRAFLVHVDEHHMAEVLKKLREAGLEARDTLHKVQLQFKYGSENKLLSLNGKELEASIRKHVGEQPEAYALKKLEALQNLGYEDGRYAFNFEIQFPVQNEDEAYNYLVDFHLGLIPYLEISNGAVRDARFGIAAPHPVDSFETGLLQIVKRDSAQPSIIKLRTEDGKQQVRLNAEMYLPHGLEKVVPEKFLRVRFALPHIDIIVGLHSIETFSLKFSLPNFKERFLLKQVHPAAEIICLLDYAYQHNTPVVLEIAYDGKVVREGTLVPASTVDTSILELMTTVRYAWAIAKHFNIEDEVELRAVELMRHQELIGLISTALSAHRTHVAITTWVERDILTPEICTPFASYLPLGQYVLAVALAAVGSAVPTGQTKAGRREYRIETGDVRLVRGLYQERSKGAPISIKALTQSVIEEYQDKTNVLITEGLHDEYLDERES
jgi:hypothetical protein